MKRFSTLIFIFTMKLFQVSAVTPEQVVHSALVSYPDVINSLLDLNKNRERQRSLSGQFDAKLKGQTDSRYDGYYDGKSYKLQIEKPLPYFNSKIYSGYRRSNGDYPVYEGKAIHYQMENHF